MKEIFGLTIDTETIYSDDKYMIVQEIIANNGYEYDMQKACEESKKIWGSGYQAHEQACIRGDIQRFFNKYPSFKSVLLKVVNCDAGRYYKTGREIEGMTVFKKWMSDEEFYRMTEYQ